MTDDPRAAAFEQEAYILTAAKVADIASVLDDQDYGEDPSISDCKDLCRSHERLRVSRDALKREVSSGRAQAMATDELTARFQSALVLPVRTGDTTIDAQARLDAVLRVHNAVTEVLRADRDRLRQQVATLTEERERAQRQLMEWEEREAKCCPEDVGFEEHIRDLQQQVDVLKPGGMYAWKERATKAEAERDALSADLTRAWKMHGEAIGERDALREELAHAAGVQVGRAQRQWEIKSMLESMPLLANWTPGQTMRFMLEQIAAMAPPAETTGDPYRYGPNQVGNRKE